jgi:hypothetical protein
MREGGRGVVFISADKKVNQLYKSSCGNGSLNKGKMGQVRETGIVRKHFEYRFNRNVML